ncbi:sulfite exporter TauE/SafE family protein [Bradyrhizobium sp.]|uniref:sulfite exporter TauE/SafE family protein n=1 Tax=Bradyrhizobium sp. TaxID=376 RepID=UPI0023A38397|nr:sulfite exporter TauE/SafE family protein [Bradyrhizobium sp.]MDE1935191.1 sulfite exporter TauE/SafE family protein [Bradyrhizobium sp.]
MIDPVFVASGFSVGLLVGMTGVGGGSLMTPLLILLFGVHPSTAVGTDLLYASATKAGGAAVHGWERTIHWPAVARLACGSIPASVLTLLLLWHLDLPADAARSLVNSVLCFALMLTALSLIFRKFVSVNLRARMQSLDGAAVARATVLVGIALGVLVSISSVGAGAVGATALLLLYPELPMSRIVGTDIAHAVPLTLIAGIGHWALGSIDWPLMGVLLMGSLPGIALGSYCAVRVPETALRLMLAAILVVVAGRLGAEEWRTATPNVAAATAGAPARAPRGGVVVPVAIGARPAH